MTQRSLHGTEPAAAVLTVQTATLIEQSRRELQEDAAAAHVEADGSWMVAVADGTGGGIRTTETARRLWRRCRRGSAPKTVKVVADDRPRSEPECHKIVMRSPSALARLPNTASSVPSYEFSASVRWENKRLSPVWEQRMAGRRAVGYTIRRVDARRRLECSRADDAPSEEEQPSLRGLHSGRVLAVDFNADHFACSMLDGHGNAVGAPARFLFCSDGSTQRRRGVLAAALQEMLSYAQHEECRSLVVENLGFGDIKNPAESMAGSARGASGIGRRCTISRRQRSGRC